MCEEAILVAGALLLVAAAPANAATARVESRCAKAWCDEFIAYEAAAGERNVVTGEVLGAETVLRDAGATITAGAGCLAVAGGVRCATSYGHDCASVSIGAQPADLRLNATGRRLLRRAGTLRVQVERHFKFSQSETAIVSGFRIDLRL